MQQPFYITEKCFAYAGRLWFAVIDASWFVYIIKNRYAFKGCIKQNAQIEMAESNLAVGAYCDVFVSRHLFLYIRKDNRTGKAGQHSARECFGSPKKGDCSDL